MTTHTQNDEQQHILKACEQCTQRRVLDIGAWAAEDKSNSRALIELGWEAVLIEPSPGPVKGLMEFYGDWPMVHIVAAAVGLTVGLARFDISDDATSTSVQANAERWEQTFIGQLWVPVITLAQILFQFGSFDCVSIDAEGQSVDILLALLKTEMFPKCIVVEHDGRIHEVLNAAAARGYRPVYSNQENMVLVHG